MSTVQDLTTSILGSLKDEEGGRVALYHYLKNFVKPDAVVNPELINGFFNEALLLPHWQEKKKDLFLDVHQLLQRFFSQNGELFRYDLLWDLSRLQLVRLENIESLIQGVINLEQSRQKEGENLRVLKESDQRAMAINRSSHGEVTIRTYSNLVFIQGTSFIPLMADQELFYDRSLELALGKSNRLRLGPHSQVRFTLDEKGADVQFNAGFAFRQNQVQRVSNISADPRLFYPLKRLERFYVYRPSDPYYMELLSTLDRALQMLHSRAEGAQSFALQAFDGGQIAFDQIFPDDKALYMRLRELAKWTKISSHTQEV